MTHTAAGVAEAAIRAGRPRGTKTPSGCRPRNAPLDDDHAGLLWRVEGGKLMIMSADSAIIETTTGQQELALAWEITSGESQVGAQ